jgi:DHA2 family multidrug resistance protein
MTQLYVHDPSYLRRVVERIDYWGLGLLVVGIGALQIVLDKGQQEDWFESRFITTLAVLSAAGLVALVVRELTADHPILDLSVFRVRSYSAGVILITTLGFVLYGSTVLLPLMMQGLFGYSAFDAGLAMLPRGAASFLCMPIIGLLVARLDPRRLLATGIIIVSGSLFMLSRLSLDAGYRQFFIALVIQGMAMGLLFIPLTTISMDSIPRERMGNATSLFNLMRNIGGSFGIATVTTILAQRTQLHINEVGAHVTPFSQAARAQLGGIRDGLVAAGSDPVTAMKQAEAIVFGRVQQQAAMMSYDDAFLIIAVLFLVMLALVPLMSRPSHQRRPVAVE